MRRPPVKAFYVLSQTATSGELRWCVVDHGPDRDTVEASAERRTEFAEQLRDREIAQRQAAGELDPPARHVLFAAWSADEIRAAGLGHLIEGPLTDTKGTIA